MQGVQARQQTMQGIDPANASAIASAGEATFRAVLLEWPIFIVNNNPTYLKQCVSRHANPFSVQGYFRSRDHCEAVLGAC